MTMKFIITEEQYNKNINQYIRFWIKRRYELVMDALKETMGLLEFEICRVDEYEKFEKMFFSVFMDCLHPYFYDEETFNMGDYDVMFNTLKDLFYVECTEYYYDGRENC